MHKSLKPRALCLLMIMILAAGSLNAQFRTYLNLETGPHWSLVKVDDPGSLFEPASLSSQIYGLTIEQEIFEAVSISSGVYYQPYQTGINMGDERRFQSQQHAYNSLMIPLRIRYRIQPTDYPVFFMPQLGYMYCINTLPENLPAGNNVLGDPEGISYSYAMQEVGELPAGHLLELGLSLGIRFGGMWQASLNLSYLSGVLNQSATSFELEYSDGQGFNRTATYTTKGNGVYTTLSLQAPLSLIWQNKDYRIRSRIERGTFAGKSLERKGELYLGGEVGLLWRLFDKSNPAIGARPMTDRGFLRYANLHTGIYGGYMLSNELGIDLGVLYQRSSAFYSVMFDHEVDYAGKLSSPFYLEIPLRLRYHYPLLEQKLFAVVYGGASALMQFSGNGQSGPAGVFQYTDPTTQSPQDASASSVQLRGGMVRPVMRIGAGAEYRIPIEFPLFATFYVNYMQGFMMTDELEITTTLPEVPEVSTVSYLGSGWSLDLGIRIPMSFDDRQDCVRLTRKK